MNPFLLLKTTRFRVFYRLFTKAGVPLVTYGGQCQWTFHDTGLGPDSRVLCAGAGHDISFEKAMIAAFGCRVVLLDPSPTGIATVQRDNIPADRLHFLPLGLAGQNGVLSFQEPTDPQEGSFRDNPARTPGGLHFPCKTLSTLMAERSLVACRFAEDRHRGFRVRRDPGHREGEVGREADLRGIASRPGLRSCQRRKDPGPSSPSAGADTT